ncbi:MAG: hypothetical protein ACPGVG_14280 [Mycobacterium sp.]
MTVTLAADDRRILTLAVHEAGHAIVGTIYGAKVDHAALAENNNDGLCRFTTSVLGATPAQYRAQIAAAGAVAAALFTHGPRPRLHQIEGLLGPGDRRELRLAALSNGGPFTDPIIAVTPLIRRCWDPIGELAATLAVDSEIRHPDVCAALGLSPDPDRAAFQLALLRSGSAPGSFSIK